ncbi:MAG: phage tail protein [Cyclobacteriaceae bacterium]|jgi:phage tail-like protein|nr:phage tail protein [Cyclobacteriaceae bacterium]
MAGEAQDNVWPLPKFHFKVEIDGGFEGSFQEVSGLDTEVDIIEYRHGDSPEFSTIKMPGLRKSSDISLKKGTFTGDIEFFTWFNEIQMNTIERKTVTIMLLNEKGEAEIIWTLTNAFPMKVVGTDLNSSSSEVAVEELVLAHEGIAFTTA